MNVLNSAPKPNDVPLEPGPSDSVTALEWNPVVDYLAVSSWDHQVRVYEVNPSTGQVGAKAAVQHEAPALGLSWSKVGLSLSLSILCGLVYGMFGKPPDPCY